MSVMQRRHTITNTLNLSKSYRTTPFFSPQRIFLLFLLASLYLVCIYLAVTSPYIPASNTTPSQVSISTNTTSLPSTIDTNSLHNNAPTVNLDHHTPTSRTIITNESTLSTLQDTYADSRDNKPPANALARLAFSDYCFIIVTHLVFFVVGWRFFIWKINHDVERLFTSILLFSTTFALSCSMFVLILAEILNAFHTYTRWANWKLNLAMLLFIIFVLLPISFFHEIVPKTIPASTRAVVISILYAIFFYFSMFFRNPLTSHNPQYEHYSRLSIENGVSRLSVLGVTLIALMSGYGAINLPHQYLILLMRQISDSDLILFNRHWNTIIKTISVVKKKLLILDVQIYYQRVLDYQHFIDTSANTRITTATQCLLEQSREYEAFVQEESHFLHNNGHQTSDLNDNYNQSSLNSSHLLHNTLNRKNNGFTISQQNTGKREGLSQMNDRRRGSTLDKVNITHKDENQSLYDDFSSLNTSVDTDYATDTEPNNLGLSLTSLQQDENYNNIAPITSTSTPHQLTPQLKGLNKISLLHQQHHQQQQQYDATDLDLNSNNENTTDIKDFISPPSFTDVYISRYDTTHSHILPARILGKRSALPLRYCRSHIQQLPLALPKTTSVLTNQIVVDPTTGNQRIVEIAQRVPVGVTTEVDGALDFALSQCLPAVHSYHPENRTDLYPKRRVHNLIPNTSVQQYHSQHIQPPPQTQVYSQYPSQIAQSILPTTNNSQFDPFTQGINKNIFSSEQPTHQQYQVSNFTNTTLPFQTPNTSTSFTPSINSISNNQYNNRVYTATPSLPISTSFITNSTLDNIPTISIASFNKPSQQITTFPSASLAHSTNFNPQSHTSSSFNTQQSHTPPSQYTPQYTSVVRNIQSTTGSFDNFGRFTNGPLPSAPPPPHLSTYTPYHPNQPQQYQPNINPQHLYHSHQDPHQHANQNLPITPLRQPHPLAYHHPPTTTLFQQNPSSIHQQHIHDRPPSSSSSISSFNNSPPFRPNKSTMPSSLTKDSINREFYPTRILSFSKSRHIGTGGLSLNLENRSIHSNFLYGSGFRKRVSRPKRFSPWNVLNYPCHWFLSLLSCFYTFFIKIFTCTYVSKRGKVQKRTYQLLRQNNININLDNDNGDDIAEQFDDFSTDDDDDYYDDELVRPPVHLYRGNANKHVTNFNGVIGDASNTGAHGIPTGLWSRYCSGPSSTTILTSYQYHMVYLTHALTRQQEIMSTTAPSDSTARIPSRADISSSTSMATGGTANVLHSSLHSKKSKNIPSSSLASSSSTQPPNHAMQHFLSKRDQLLTQLSIQLDIQRRLSTDIYQLSFERQQYRKQTNTLLGQFQNFSSYFLAVFGLGKIILTLKNIIFGKDPKSVDIPTRFMTFIIQNIFHIHTVNVQWWISYVSLIFLGGLVATQMRGFLINFTKIFRTFALFISPSAMLSVATMIMGVYFVSMVLLSRIHLPSTFRTAITHVLGHLQFDFYHNWFDLIFLIAAVTTLSIFYTFRKMRPTNDTFADGYN